MIDPPPPAELSFLTDAIGAEATLALIEARAGTRVYVPGQINADGWLAKAIGTTGAAALAEAHGGCYITPPAAKRWRAHVYRTRGQSYAEIALRIGVAERTVWKYLGTSLGTRASAGQVPRRRGDLKSTKQTEMPL